MSVRLRCGQASPDHLPAAGARAAGLPGGGRRGGAAENRAAIAAAGRPGGWTL